MQEPFRSFSRRCDTHGAGTRAVFYVPVRVMLMLRSGGVCHTHNASEGHSGKVAERYVQKVDPGRAYHTIESSSP